MVKPNSFDYHQCQSHQCDKHEKARKIIYTETQETYTQLKYIIGYSTNNKIISGGNGY